MKFSKLPLALVALALFSPIAARAEEPLVVHEWGTFTCLQDETGRAVGAINSDDEPVPAFVHDIGGLVRDNSPQRLPSKGLPPSLAAVTMRLETPVLYFHLPRGVTSLRADVEVGFKGGWLSQFYPKAEAETPGLQEAWSGKAPTSETFGKLKWKGLVIEGHKSGPKCNDRVWKAPRQARAESVTTPAGEREQFLFYRGLGHLNCPLSTTTDKAGQIELHSKVPLGHIWLTDIRAGGAAYVHLGSLSADTKLTPPSGGTAANLVKLKKEMKAALIEDGLYPDEAQAMLDAWQLSYFESPGRRIFFIVPHSWTDQVLPLSIKTSRAVQTSRVMIGRIELVSPEQRKILNDHKRGDLSKDGKLGRFGHALLKDINH